jgi:hypothetical protein
MVNGRLTSSAGWSVTQPASGAISFSQAGVRINSVDGSLAQLNAGFSIFTATSPLTPGNMYRISFDVQHVSGTVQVTGDSGTVYLNVNATGRYDVVFIAGNHTNLIIKRATACDMTLSNLALTDLGIGASQATAGFQPKLRKGAKNLAIWSEDLTQSAWSKTSVAVVANQYTLPNGISLSKVSALTDNVNHKVQLNASGLDNATSVLQFYCKASGETFLRAEVIGNVGSSGSRVTINLAAGTFSTQAVGSPAGATFTADVTPIGDDVYKVVITCTPTSTGNSTRNIVLSLGASIYAGDGTSGVLIGGVNLYQGGVEQTYSKATGWETSNGVGNWWLDFDGVQTRLNLSAVPIAGGAQGFVSLGLNFNPAGFTGLAYPYGMGVLANNTSLWASVYFSTGNPLIGICRNDAAGTFSAQFGSTANNVYSLVVDSRLRSRTGGMPVVDVGVPSLPVTINTACIGAIRRSNNYDSLFRGGISVLAIGQIDAVPLGDLSAIEAYIAERLPV